MFGYYRNELLNLVMTGLEGKVNMNRMLDALRSDPPATIGGMTVAAFEDLRNESGRLGPYRGETDRAARNFLIFRLEQDGMTAKVCLRPSGTEPKAKAYLEVSCEPWRAGMGEDAWTAVCSAVDRQVQQLATDFLTRAMSTVGQTPAPGADKLSR
jgi:phosphoglucomutase/phosphomannomutase